MNSLSRKLGIPALVLAIGFSFASTALAQDNLFGRNLIKNGDAETGTASADGSATDVPSWSKRTGSVFSIMQYGGRSDSLLPNSDGPPAEGANSRGSSFFCGGNGDAETITQRIDLSSAQATIDKTKVKYDLSGWLGGYDTQEDNAILRATFLTDNNVAIGVAVIGPVLAAERKNATRLVQKAVSGTVPQGTRRILVELKTTRKEGTLNDAYADNLSLVLNGPATASTAAEPNALFDQGAVKFAIDAGSPDIVLDVTPIDCARVSVSSDGTSWFDVGVIEPPSTTIKLANLLVNPPTQGRVKFVRVTIVPGAHMSFRDSVLFDTNKSTLKQEAQSVLHAAAERLKEIPHAKLIVDGHTDNVGGAEYNYHLSVDRAAAVKEFLVKEGVSSGTTSIRGWGEQRPIASNESDSGKAQNRRVEIIVVPQEEGFRLGKEQ